MRNLKWWLSLVQFYMFSAGEEGGGTEDDIDLDDVEADSTTEDQPAEPETMLDALTKEIGTVEAPKVEENPDDKAKPEIGADGKPIVKDGAKIEPTAEEKAAAEAAKKAITEDDLKMPDGLSAKAQERFQKLSSGYKEAQTKIADIEARYEQSAAANMEFVQTMDAVGAGPDQLNTFIDYMSHIKAGDLEKAHAILSAELNEISLRMGKELPGVDLLKDYPDLLEDVENLDISRERAIEIAKNRAIQAKDTRVQTQTQQQEQQTQQVQMLKENSLKEVDKVMMQLKNNDVDYPVKERIIMESKDGKPSILQRIVQGSHPSQWLSQLTLAYDAIQVTKSESTRQTNPLRSSSGGGKAAPTTMLEAISQGLDQGN
jgi:hypothetical protein